MMSVAPPIVSSCPPSPTPRPLRPRASSATSVRESMRVNPGSGENVSPTSSKNITIQREPIDLPRRRRVKSAVTPDSRVMTVPANNTPYGSKVWGETCYTSDYPPKKVVVRIKPRPSSATRMHNPHPSKMFLQWRIPTRIHPHPRSTQVDPSFLKDIQENFYQDYLADENKTGQARHEVPITNVAKIPFPGNMKTNTNLEVHGNQLPLVNSNSDGGLKLDNPIIEPHEKVLQRTLQPPSYMAYQQWIQDATEDEKKVLAKMLKAAHIEDSKVKKALADVFTKDSLKYIKQWMHGADQKELLLAMKVIEKLSRQSQVYSDGTVMTSTSGGGSSTVDGSHVRSCKQRLRRSRSWPKKEVTRGDYNFSIQGKKLRPHSADQCSECSNTSTGSIYNAVKNNRLKLKYSQSTPAQAILWHHKVKLPPKPKLLNEGAVFGLPYKPRGQHYALHPEWPIA